MKAGQFSQVSLWVAVWVLSSVASVAASSPVWAQTTEPEPEVVAVGREDAASGAIAPAPTVPALTSTPSPAELDLPATTVEQWIAQIEAALVQITDVRIEATESGLAIVLETEGGAIAVPATRVVGNALIADIANATIAEEFSQANPIEGIALVTVTSLPSVGGASPRENRVRVAITGTDAPPVAEVRSASPSQGESEAQGLVLGVALGAAGTVADEEAIEVIVTGEQYEGYNPSSATTATRTDTPLRDIPQAIQIIPQEVIEDRGASRVVEALETATGVIAETGERSPRASITTYNVRGFASFGADILVNGVPEQVASNRTTVSNIERIEVLRGPASVLFGQGSLGGRINIVTERPLRTPRYVIEASAGNFSAYSGAIDLTGSINPDGTLLYRLNAFADTTESFVDFYERQRYNIAPVLTWQISDQTTITLDTEYENTQASVDPGLPVEGTILPNPNGKIPRDRFLGEPSFSRSDVEFFRIGFDLEHRFSETWQGRSVFRFTRSSEQVQAPFFLEVLADGRTLSRAFDEFETEFYGYSLNNYIVGQFSTGSIQHQVLAGFDLFRRDVFPFTLNDRTGVSPNTIDIFNPIYGRSLPGEGIPIVRVNERTQGLGLYLQDQVTLIDNLILLLGGRFDITNQQTDDLLASTTQFQQDEAFSPRVGIVYQPIEPISLYASYNRSFSPSIGRSADGSQFEPERGTQYEIGVKADINDDLSTTLALFHLTRTNVTTADPDNANFSIQTGEQRSQGIEFDLSGEILPGWDITLGYAFTDAEVTDDNTIPVGNQLSNTPEHSASLWTTYEIQSGDLQGLGFGLGLLYVGDRPGDLENTFNIPGYLRTDAAIYYRREQLRLALNVRNLFDIEYFASAGGRNSVFYGDPFTIQASISWQF